MCATTEVAASEFLEIQTMCEALKLGNTLCAASCQVDLFVAHTITVMYGISTLAYLVSSAPLSPEGQLKTQEKFRIMTLEHSYYIICVSPQGMSSSGRKSQPIFTPREEH